MHFLKRPVFPFLFLSLLLCLFSFTILHPLSIPLVSGFTPSLSSRRFQSADKRLIVNKKRYAMVSFISPLADSCLYAVKDEETSDENSPSATEENEMTLSEKMKNAGVSGVVAYALTELGFWLISLPSAVVYYHYQTNEWLNFATSEDKVKVAAFSAAFVSFARLVVPLRLGLALALTPFISKTIVQPLQESGLFVAKDAENE